MANEITSSELTRSAMLFQRRINLPVNDNPSQIFYLKKILIALDTSTNYKYQTGGLPISHLYDDFGLGSNVGDVVSVWDIRCYGGSAIAPFFQGVPDLTNKKIILLTSHPTSTDAEQAWEEVANDTDISAAAYLNSDAIKIEATVLCVGSEA